MGTLPSIKSVDNKKPADQKPESKWTRRWKLIWSGIQEDNEGKKCGARSWSSLIKAGCDPGRLAGFLLQYTADENGLRNRSLAEHFANNEELGRRLCREIESIQRTLKDIRARPPLPVAPNAVQVRRRQGASTPLDRELKTLHQKTKTILIPRMRALRSRRGPYRKAALLVDIVWHLRTVSGKPHFSALAQLLQVANDALSQHDDILETENLTKVCARYERMHPEMTAHFRRIGRISPC